MPSNSQRWRRPVGLLVLSGLILLPANAKAQAYSQEQAKAEALISLASFIRWPPGTILPAPAPITFCMLGSGGTTAEELESSARRQEIAQHKLIVRRMQGPEDLADCHLVFLGAGAKKYEQKLIDAADGLPVVLVAEIPGFARRGGTITLGLQNRRIALEINAESAEKARLKINPRLLAVADVVHTESKRRESP